MNPLPFAQGLLDRGIELLLHGNRLSVWPSKAYAHLTAAERSFIRTHRDELKDLARAKALPEATVQWSPDGPRGPLSAAPELTVAAPTCAYCGDRPCVGPDNAWFRVLHWRSPEETARRNAEATQQMYERVGR